MKSPLHQCRIYHEFDYYYVRKMKYKKRAINSLVFILFKRFVSDEVLSMIHVRAIIKELARLLGIKMTLEGILYSHFLFVNVKGHVLMGNSFPRHLVNHETVEL